jgi:hypothetical protein
MEASIMALEWQLWPFATCCTASILGRKRGIAEIDRPTSIEEGDARDPTSTRLHEVDQCQ